MRGVPVLNGAQIQAPLASSRQVGDVAHLYPIGLRGTRLGEQQVWGTALPVSGIGGARDEGLGRQGLSPVPVQARTQTLAAHPVALFPQLDLQPARAVMAFVMVKHSHYLCFPGWLLLPHHSARRR